MADCIIVENFCLCPLKIQNGQPDPVAQSVGSLTADPGVTSSVRAWSHTFMEIDHEIISTVNLLISADSRRGVIS